MVGARSTLNKLKWMECDFSKAEIWYVHRGAPNDTKIVSGADIIDIGRAFLELRARFPNSGLPVGIPYHRIFRIVYDGKVVYDKRQMRMEKEQAP